MLVVLNAFHQRCASNHYFPIILYWPESTIHFQNKKIMLSGV